MKPLPTSHQAMTWLSMCYADESTSKTKRFCYAAFTLSVGTFELFIVISDIISTVKYFSINLETCLSAVFQVACHLAMLNLIIVGITNRQHISALFAKLAELYTANKTDTSFRFLIEANNKSEWLWRIYSLGSKGVMINLMGSSIASVIYSFYKNGIFNADILYKPFILLLPWNQNTPIGYFGEMIVGLFNGGCYMFCNGVILIMFISMCWHHQAFYKRFRYTTGKLDHTENQHNANQILRELIHFHIATKDWFLQSAGVYSMFVLIQLICNVIFMAAVILELDLRIHSLHIDFEFVMFLNALPVGVSNLYIYCYFGQLATESYEKMTECLYESNWYELPLDMQKKCLLMILNMQKPILYHGFGVAVLNL